MLGEAEIREIEEETEQWKPKDGDVPGQMAKLSEELGEAQAALGKTMRWGFFSYDPTVDPDQRRYNVDWLRAEMRDVTEAWEKLWTSVSGMDVADLRRAEPRFQTRADE